MAREPFAPGGIAKTGKSQQNETDDDASGAPLGQPAVVAAASGAPTGIAAAERSVEIVDDGDKPGVEQDAAEQSRVDLSELAPDKIDSSIGTDDLGATDDEDTSGFDLGLPQRASADELAARLGPGQGQDQGQGGDPGQGPDPRYGKDMISEVSQGGATPGSGYVFTDSSGEIKGIGNAASGDGMFFGVDVGAMRMEKEETERAAEHDAQQGGDGGESDAGGGEAGGDSGGGGDDDSEGLVTHEQDNADGSHSTVYNDGTIITAYPDGTLETSYEDGTVETDYPDGTLKTENPDGSTETIHPDGTTTTTEPGEAEDGASTPKDDDVLTPEEKAALREQLAPLELHRGSQNDPGTETQPAEGDAAFGVGSGTVSVSAAHDEALRMFGQPGPGDTDFGGGGGGGGNQSGDPNFGTIDPTDDADQPPQTDGPEQDPFDRQQETFEPPASDSEQEAEESDGEPLGLARTDLRPIDHTEELRRVEIDAG